MSIKELAAAAAKTFSNNKNSDNVISTICRYWAMLLTREKKITKSANY